MNRLIASLLIVGGLGACGCRPAPVPKTFADKFTDLEEFATRDDVAQWLGPSTKVRSANFPDTPFMGPDTAVRGVVRPGQAYEVWEYVDSGEMYLVFFAGEKDDAPPHQWTVVGKTHYPQGAAF